jgi:hypothetical protein
MHSRARAAPTPTKSPPGRVLHVALALSILVLVFSAGRMSASSATTSPALAPTSNPSVRSQADLSSSSRRVARLPSVPATTTVTSPPACEEAGDSPQRLSRAEYLFDRFLERLSRQPRLPGSTPEKQANLLRSTLTGVIEAARAFDPISRVALSHELTRRLCETELGHAESIAVAYLATDMPEISTEKGFECFFSKIGRQESPRVWAMLDAWRSSGQPPTAAILALQRTALDERTRRRLGGYPGSPQRQEVTDRRHSR